VKRTLQNPRILRAVFEFNEGEFMGKFMDTLAKGTGNQLLELRRKLLPGIMKFKLVLLALTFPIGVFCSPAYSTPLSIDFGQPAGARTTYYSDDTFEASGVSFTVVGNGSAFSWVTTSNDSFTGLEALFVNNAGINIDFHEPLSYLEFNFTYYSFGSMAGRFDDSGLIINGETLEAPDGLDELDGQVLGGVTIHVQRTELPGLPDHLSSALPFFVISFTGTIDSFSLNAITMLTANYSGETLANGDSGPGPNTAVPEPSSAILLGCALLGAGIRQARPRAWRSE